MFHLSPFIRASLFALCFGAAGGGLFAAFDFPAAWLSGAMVAVAVLAFARVPLAVPGRIRDVALILMGVSMGAGFTPETLSGALRWPLSLLALGASIPAIILAGSLVLRRIAGWDRQTAFFAVVPGALTFVMAMALESKADAKLVALAQSLRLFMLVALLPPLIVAGAPAPDLVAASAAPAALQGASGLTALIAAGFLGAWAARRGGAIGFMFGAMGASAILHAFGIVGGPLPDAILIPCMVTLGCLIGMRFEGATLGLLRRAIGPSFAALAATLAVAASFALAVAWTLDVPAGQALIAFAPGGLEAMMLVALALGLDPAYVGVHQIARFVGLSLALAFLARPFLKEDAKDG